MTFIERIEKYAGAKNTADLARWCDLHYNTVKNYMKTGRMPEAEILLKLHREKGLSIDWMLTGEGSPTTTAAAPVNTPGKESAADQAEEETTARPDSSTFNAVPERVTLSGTTRATVSDASGRVFILEIPAITITITETARASTSPGVGNAVNIPLLDAVQDSP